MYKKMCKKKVNNFVHCTLYIVDFFSIFVYILSQMGKKICIVFTNSGENMQFLPFFHPILIIFFPKFVHCTLNIVYCTLCNVHGSMYIVPLQQASVLQIHELYRIMTMQEKFFFLFSSNTFPLYSYFFFSDYNNKKHRYETRKVYGYSEFGKCNILSQGCKRFSISHMYVYQVGFFSVKIISHRATEFW